jgi:hypothetical protein
MKPAATSGLFECALAIARERSETLTQLRRALERNNTADVIRLAKELTGLQEQDDHARKVG